MNFDQFVQNLPLLHSWDGGQTWNTGGFTEGHLRPLVDFMRENLPARPSIIETGAGCSTITFMLLDPERIISIAPDADLFSRIRSFCRAHGINTSVLDSRIGFSEWVLPEIAQPSDDPPWADLVLIDGGHGWPTTFVDFFYMNHMLRQGGYMMVDDVNLASLKELVQLLQEQPGYELALDLGKALVFRKMTADRLLPDWYKQPYIVRRTEDLARSLARQQMNIHWNFAADDETSVLNAHGGWEYGSTIEEAWPQLVEKKKWDAKRTREALELGPDDVVAEIGPGLGIVASILASEVQALHLFDISSSFRAACKKHVTATNVHFHLMKPGDLSPLVGKGINKIYAEGVFIHFNLFDIYLYLKQIEFMLPHGGRFTFNIISSDYEGLLDDPVWQEQAEQYRCDKTRVFGLMSWLSPITVQKLLKRVGFLVADVTWPEQQYVHFTVIKP